VNITGSKYNEVLTKEQFFVVLLLDNIQTRNKYLVTGFVAAYFREEEDEVNPVKSQYPYSEYFNHTSSKSVSNHY